MVTSKFDDSLDGSITKPTISPLLLEVKQPNRGSQRMITAGEVTESRLLKMFETHEDLTGYWVAKEYDMPARTACSGLIRLANKGILTDTHEMRKSEDNRNHLCHVYRLAKKDAIKGRKGKRNIKKV